MPHTSFLLKGRKREGNNLWKNEMLITSGKHIKLEQRTLPRVRSNTQKKI